MSSTLEISSPDFEPVAEQVPGAAVTVNENGNNPASESAPLLSTDALKPWSGTERISILLLGIDQRCEEKGPAHTDTMMILTIDPVGLSASMLSLPRDLWVEIPEVGLDRINQAHYFGELYEYPGGGPALAMETVSALLGIPLNYYVTVNFDAFIEVVDLIGGITIDVPEAIDDPTYPDRCYGYDPFSIDVGTHRLDGTQALKYARTRATFGGDVDRAGRQQAVILAVRDQVLQLDMLPQLIAQSPRLWQTLQDNVRTNLTLDEGLQLALLMQEIPADSIQTAVIDYNYVYNETTPDGREVLVPNRDAIRDLRNEIFTPPAIPTPVIADLPALMREENARVALYNGTAVFGLAGATQEYLQKYGLNISEIGNADSAAYRTTQIIDYGDHPSTTRYITQLMNVPPLNTSQGSKPEGDFDVLVIIGDDWRVPEP
ncbi:MAG: LCP family protein [Ardenticatenaceae bacterium]|nr:LCP family protein [Ardenticatenaceae bacterium]MCB9443141.1 LCP family protein [Ardenticatenaceae bacterium]